MHGCVVVLDGRQPACVLRLALHALPSPPFLSRILKLAIVVYGRRACRSNRPPAKRAAPGAAYSRGGGYFLRMPYSIPSVSSRP